MSRGGRGRGGRNSAQSKLDLFPTVPPLYPECNPPEALDGSLSKYAPKLNELRQHFISNYKIDRSSNRDSPSPFAVERFSDCYSAPLKLDKSLMHHIDSRRIPQELGPKSKKVVKPAPKRAEIKANLAVARLNKKADQEEEDNDIDEPPAKKMKGEATEGNEDEEEDEEKEKEKVANIDNEELEEEMDEELDEGTDYMSNYFDNGEGYGDSDEENLDDSSVY